MALSIAAWSMAAMATPFQSLAAPQSTG
jgi:hypothetical protein